MARRWVTGPGGPLELVAFVLSVYYFPGHGRLDSLSEPVQTSEDDRILGLVRELCVQLGVKFTPLGVTWMGTLGHPLNLPSDQCVFVTKGPRRGYAVLPVELKGRLNLDDWRPLIASGIFFQLRPEIRRIWRTSQLLVLSGLSAAFVIPVLLAISGMLFNSPVFPGLLVIFGAAWYLLPRIHNLWVARRLRLKADRRAADIVGREQLIRTIVKVDGFHILDLEERKRKKQSVWQRRVFPFPTIIDRLVNLRQFPNR